MLRENQEKRPAFAHTVFFLEAKRSSAEARTLEFWNAILRVSRALPKMKNTCYGLFWVSNEKSAKAIIFWKWRPLGSLHKHTKWPKFWPFWSNGTSFPLNFKPWIWFWSQNWKIPKIPEFQNLLGISGISLGISQVWLFWLNGTSIPLSFRPWIWPFGL